MNEALQTALSLLAIGMITVFIILTLVVGGGQAIIALTNRFIPETVVEKVTSDDVPADHVAVITAAVSEITGGKGTVEHIEKTD